MTEALFDGFLTLGDGVTARLFADSYVNLLEEETVIGTDEIEGGGAWAAGQAFSRSIHFAEEENLFTHCGTEWSLLKVTLRVQLKPTSRDASGSLSLGSSQKDQYIQGLTLEWQECSDDSE